MMLAFVSTVFGMMMAVTADLPKIENFQQYKKAQNSILYDDQGRQLGETGVAAARIVGLAGRPYPLVLLGGVLRSEGAGLLRAEIASRIPEGVPAETRFEPAAGPLLMAFDVAGIGPDEDRLHETFPGTELFASA